MQPHATVSIDGIPEPTFTTLPGIASVNGVYADHNCGEEDGTQQRYLKGDSLDGAEGWDAAGDPGEWWQVNEETGEQL